MKKQFRHVQRNGRLKLESLESKRLLSVSANLIQDINLRNNPYDASLDGLTTVGDQAYFVQRSKAGFSLWHTDGTVDGTKHLKDIATQKPELHDEKHEGPQDLTGIGESLYFTALVNDKQQLWKSDGTSEGTAVIAEFELDPRFLEHYATHSIRDLTEVNGQLYFTAYSSQYGNELWKSDGTPESTVQASDIVAGPGGSYASELVDGNGIPYFVTDSGFGVGTVRTLWKLSGGKDSSVIVKQFHDKVVTGFTTLDDTLFFVTGDEEKGTALWRTDGSAAGTFAVKNIEIGNFHPNLNPLVATQGHLYFSGNDGIHGYELWSSNGTEEGTNLVKDIREGAGSSRPSSIAAFGEELVFQRGAVYWTSDGTEQGTKPAHEGSFLYSNSLTVSGDHFYFAFRGSSEATSIWASDATNDGTTQVAQFNAFRDMADLNGNLLVIEENQLWIHNSGHQHFTLLRDARATRSSISSRWQSGSRVELNGNLLFSANEGDVHYLWKSDGTQAGTSRVSEVTIAWPNSLIEVDSKVFFIGHTGTSEGRTPPLGLWVSDGSADGTRLIKDIGNGPSLRGSAPPNVLFNLDGTLFFNAYGRNSEGRELWKSDGTEQGTILVKDINPGSASSSPGNFFEFNDLLYFTAEDDQTGPQVWKSDGTTNGTTRVSNIEADWYYDVGYRGLTGSDICCSRSLYNTFTAAGESLFFAAGNALWKTDGSENGTVRVSNGNGRDHFAPSSFVEMNGTLYFVDGWDGRSLDKLTGNGQLWRSDGTVEGTVQVKQIGDVASRLVGIQELVVMNGLIFFAANDGENGRELWRSDGTDAGTWMLKDIWAGSPGSHPVNLAEVNGTLYFSAQSGGGGQQLWTSDGTPEGTVPIENGGLAPSGFTSVNDHVFYAAATEETGHEIWVLQPTRPIGDVDHDGVFNSADLVRVFQRGEYEDGIAANSTFDEGDWNGDGEFDSSDLVFAFQDGNYVNAACNQLLDKLGTEIDRVLLDWDDDDSSFGEQI